MTLILSKSHWRWALAFVVLLAAATAVYWMQPKQTSSVETANRDFSLAFGIAAASLIFIACVYSIRKRLPRWPLGPAKLWLKAHIWMGLLSVPLVLFHARFEFGRGLSQVALILLLVVVLTGCWGLLLQQILPRSMKKRVHVESAYDRIPQVCLRLRSQADKAVMRACGSLFADDAGAVASRDQLKLRDVYRHHVRPFLGPRPPRGLQLSSHAKAGTLFADLRNDVESALHDVLDQLMTICDRRRQLAMQVRLRRWLHSWLILHVPLSVCLVGAVVAHVVTVFASR
ncbi:MAG: hypothetical protein IH991_10010 [Planctomycetes bacterium]|nr:hypothetical protein [Planctomycetota bacterium]